MNKSIFILILLQLSFILHSQETTISLSDYFEKHNINKTKSFDISYLQNKVKQIIIVAPMLTSGGPEALCQLAHELKLQGFQVNLLIIRSWNEIKKKFFHNNWYICAQHNNLIPTIYKEKYTVNYLDHDFILNDSSLIILPEIWGDLIPFFNPAKIAFYWLSIANFEQIGNNTTCKFFVQNKRPDFFNCIHLSDAPWISKKLENWDIHSTLIEAPICNYYTENIPDNATKKDLIVFNPKKGAQLAQLYKKLNPNNNYFAIENLTEQEVIKSLDSAKIYIDFGHFPGKDRIPREALARGCVIFIHNQNCGSDYDSFPINDYFRFNERDIENGTLQNKVNQALNNFEDISKQQNDAREQLYHEYSKFSKQIHNLFGTPLSV